MYDAIVIGARCAGAATAMLLARRGLRVLMADRATFPSETVSGHFIMNPGTRLLGEWGLLENLIDAGTPAIRTAMSHCGDFSLEAEVVGADEAPACIGPRRSVLDQALIEAAVAAGAEFRPGCSLSALILEDGRVRGVRLRSGSTESTELASLVVGADGKNSAVARQVHAPSYREVPSKTCWYMAYWEGLPASGLEAHWANDTLALVFPTNAGLTMVAVGWPHEEFARIRSGIQAAYSAAVSAMPALAERWRQAQRTEPFMGMGDLGNFFRVPCGPGWALVGDAGHFKDPTNARGISDAFEDAELLAAAIADGLDGGDMESTLGEYHRRRDERAVPDSEFNLMRADLSSWGSPSMLALRAAVRENPAEARRMYRAITGVEPWQGFFNPQNLGRILGSATVAAR